MGLLADARAAVDEVGALVRGKNDAAIWGASSMT